MEPFTVEDCKSVWTVTPCDEEDTNIYSAKFPFETDGTIKDHMANIYSVQRYWDRRYEFWPNFDDGICTDLVGLFSVTPWDAASQIAISINEYYPNDSCLIVDACCGVGGNTNAFAHCIPSSYVFGVDISARRIVCAKKNAEVTRVSTRTDFVMQDVIQFLQHQNHSVRFVFCSPPWGGPGYTIESYDDIPFDIHALAEATAKACVNGEMRLVLFLPRDFPPEVAKEIAPHGTKMGMIDVTSGKKKRPIGRCFLYGKVKKHKEKPNKQKNQ